MKDMHIAAIAPRRASQLARAGAIFSLIWLYLLAGLGSAGAAEPQKGPRNKTRILLVFDCSNSMNAKWGRSTRIAGAKQILSKIVDSVDRLPNVELALRCYGHQSSVAKHDCKDTRLEIPFAAGNGKKIREFVKNVQPAGYTPIAYSLSQSAEDFPPTPPGKVKNIVILITDGIEECEGDPCVISRQLQAKNIILKPYIVGIGLGAEKVKFFDCVGKYYDASNEKELNNVFVSVMGQALGTTTLSLHLLDSRGKPTETDVAFTLLNSRTGNIEYNYIQTLNAGVPDTFSIDPSLTYDLQVSTVPGLMKRKVNIKPGQHNIIELPAPQGTLSITCASARQYQNLPCVVRPDASTETVNVQIVNSAQSYITGIYEVEVLCLPRMVRKVRVGQGQVTQLVVPEPGQLRVSYNRDVIGSIYLDRGGKLEWVTDLTSDSRESQEQFILQPGKYVVVYRPLNSYNTIDTRERSLDLPEGGSVTIEVG